MTEAKKETEATTGKQTIEVTAKQVKEAIQMAPTLRALGGLAVGANFKIAHFIRAIETAAEGLQSEYDNALETYCEKDEDGTRVNTKDAAGKDIQGSFKLKDPEGYHKTMKEIDELKINIECNKIKLGTFDNARGTTPGMFAALLWWIE